MRNSKTIKAILLLVTVLIVSIGYFTFGTSNQLKTIRSESEAIRNSVTMGEVVSGFESDGGRTLIGGKPSSATLRTEYTPTSNKSTENLFDELEMLLLNNNWRLSRAIREDGTSLRFNKTIDDKIFTAALTISKSDSQNNIVYIRLESKPFL